MKSLRMTQAVSFDADSSYVGWDFDEIKFSNNEGCTVGVNLSPELMESLLEQLKKRVVDYHKRQLNQLKEKGVNAD